MKEICRVNYVIVEKSETNSKMKEILGSKVDDIKILEINSKNDLKMFQYGSWINEKINFKIHNIIIITTVSRCKIYPTYKVISMILKIILNKKIINEKN